MLEFPHFSTTKGGDVSIPALLQMLEEMHLFMYFYKTEGRKA
jgi:hypothetical protein